jgi:hypothetical protein
MRLIAIASALGFAMWAASVHAQDTASPPQLVPESRPAPPVTAPATKPLAERKLLPVDEGAVDPTWVAFRNRLQAALKRGDRRTLLAVVDRNILNALDAPRGIAEFRRHWDLDGKDDRLLRDLMSALVLGSAWYAPAKGPKLLCAPYVPIKWPLDAVDPYDNGAIVAKDVLVKGAPSHASETLGALSYDLIEVRDWEVADAETRLQQRWIKVRYRERDGYVPVEQIRSAIEPRACFVKEGGGWRMTEYVIGIEYLGGDK